MSEEGRGSRRIRTIVAHTCVTCVVMCDCVCVCVFGCGCNCVLWCVLTCEIFLRMWMYMLMSLCAWIVYVDVCMDMWDKWWRGVTWRCRMQKGCRAGHEWVCEEEICFWLIPSFTGVLVAHRYAIFLLCSLYVEIYIDDSQGGQLTRVLLGVDLTARWWQMWSK